MVCRCNMDIYISLTPIQMKLDREGDGIFAIVLENTHFQRVKVMILNRLSWVSLSLMIQMSLWKDT